MMLKGIKKYGGKFFKKVKSTNINVREITTCLCAETNDPVEREKLMMEKKRQR